MAVRVMRGQVNRWRWQRWAMGGHDSAPLPVVDDVTRGCLEALDRGSLVFTQWKSIRICLPSGNFWIFHPRTPPLPLCPPPPPYPRIHPGFGIGSVNGNVPL